MYYFNADGYSEDVEIVYHDDPSCRYVNVRNITVLQQMNIKKLSEQEHLFMNMKRSQMALEFVRYVAGDSEC